MLCNSSLARPCARYHSSQKACVPARHVRLACLATKTAPTTTQTALSDEQEEISTEHVTMLLNTLTQPDMEIAELSLKMGDLSLRVRRSVEAAQPAPAAAQAPVHAAPVVAPQPTLQPALHLAPAPYVSIDESGPAEESMDESLVSITANRVGVFRRGKSKAKVGDQVKKGQILGAIEQLGTLVDVKAPLGGEVVSYKVSDGEPVEYGGAIVYLAPFFGVEEAGVTTYRGV